MGAKNTPAFFQHKVETALRKDRLLDVGMLRMSVEGVVAEFGTKSYLLYAANPTQY